MSLQRPSWPLWPESPAQPHPFWSSRGGRHPGRLLYRSAGPRAVVALFGHVMRNLSSTYAAESPGLAVSRLTLAGAAGAILRNPFRGVVCPVRGVAAGYDRRE